MKPKTKRGSLMRITNEELRDLVYEDYLPEKFKGWEKVSDEHVHKNRWTESRSLVLKTPEGIYWEGHYDEAFNEMDGWEEANWDSYYDLVEVVPKEVIKIEYVVKKNDSEKHIQETKLSQDNETAEGTSEVPTS